MTTLPDQGQDFRFGTSGLRGLAVDLLNGGASLYADAFCRFLLAEKLAMAGDSLFLGRDLRPSSEALSAVCAAVAERHGLRIRDCAAISTPALALSAIGEASAALMVTGSHIPADRNGLKFFVPGGEITKAHEQEITARVGAPVPGEPSLPRRRGDERSAVAERYRQRYAGLLDRKALGAMRVGVYLHSAVAMDLVQEIVAGFGAEVVPFGASVDFTPLDTEAIDEDLIDLFRRQAAALDLAAIISTDPDGDRPLVCDRHGSPLRGDLLGWIAALAIGADHVVTPITSNSAVHSSAGRAVTRTRIGSPYVLAAMDDAVRKGARAVCGFEANGGFLLASRVEVGSATLQPLPTRDSMIPILFALQALRGVDGDERILRSRHGFRAAASGLIRGFAATTLRAFTDRLRENRDAFSALFAPFGDGARVDDLDGLRVTFASGRVIHVRPSGNAPELRVYCEDSGEDCEALLAGAMERTRALLDAFR